MEEVQIQKYENLVFEGCGILGFAYCGVISELEKQGMLQNFKRFAGTSAGAIFAALLSANFTSDEVMKIHKIMFFDNLSTKYDLSSVFNISKNYGINSSSSIRKHINVILNTKFNQDVTMSELFKKTGKELVLVSCCLNREKPIYFHHATFPNVKVIDAIIASLSVPLFFHPLPLTVFETEDYFVDGGVVDNYPIWIFNNIEALYQGELSNLNKEQINPLTLGLKLLGASNISQNYNRKPVESVFNFITQLINTMISQSNISSFSPSWIQQTILIPTGSIYFLNIDINNEKIEELLKHGTDAIQKHFKKE